MREYENNGTTENNNFKNNIAASMTTLMINIHISCLVFIFFDFLFFHKVETKPSIPADDWFTKDPGLLSHGKLWMRGWRMDAGHED